MFGNLFAKKATKPEKVENDIIIVKPRNNQERLVMALGLVTLAPSVYQEKLQSAKKKLSAVPKDLIHEKFPIIIDEVFLSFCYDPKYLEYCFAFFKAANEQDSVNSGTVTLVLDEDSMPSAGITDADMELFQKASYYGQQRFLQEVHSGLNKGYHYNLEYFSNYLLQRNLTQTNIQNYDFTELYEKIDGDESLEELIIGDSPDDLRDILTDIAKLIALKEKVSFLGYDMALFIKGIEEAYRVNFLDQTNLFTEANKVLPYLRKYFDTWDDYARSYMLGKAYVDESLLREELDMINDIKESIIKPLNLTDFKNLM